LVRAPQELAAAAAPYECVRITDLRDVDVRLLRFDFDLTLAVVLMNADGTIYHRFGTRPGSDPLAWSSIPALVQLLRDTLDDHRSYERAPSPPRAQPPLRAIDLPPLQQRLAAGQKVECVHCHMVHDAEHRIAVDSHAWRDSDKWLHPEPARLGLDLDPADQARVRAVAGGSPAAAAGLRAGDRLLRISGGPRLRTIADVQWELHHAVAGACELSVEFARAPAAGQTAPMTATATVVLPDGWKECSPRDYAWRPFQWNLSPSPGFGGPMLTAAERRERGLPPDRLALRVQYIVDWGERAAGGKAVRAAGVKEGDIVLSFAGADDFEYAPHFQAWVRLHCHVGDPVHVTLLRDGERRTVHYALPE